MSTGHHRYDECQTLSPFVDAGKAAFHTEYTSSSQAGAVCAITEPLGLSTIIKSLDLDAYRVACP